MINKLVIHAMHRKLNYIFKKHIKKFQAIAVTKVY